MSGSMVIVGAGQAGLQVAESLRAEGYDGAVTLIGAEGHAPYHRPPLSKGILLGQTEPAQIEIRSAAALARKNLDLRTATTAQAIDRAKQKVRLTDGTTLDYDGLAIATGARLRQLSVPGAELDGVMGLRGLDDALALMRRLPTLRRAVVIGGGFIGLEVAAALRTGAVAVTVLEAAPRLLARVASPTLSDFHADLHRAHGVDLVCGAQVVAVEGTDGRVQAVRTADGGRHAADLVVVGIGVIANDDLARAAGLACAGGVVVDACGRTADPRIVAAGDCAIRPGPDGTMIRLESVQNAVEQGKAAAAALLGREKPFTATPWFWSDQYDVKVQMVGSSAGHDHVVVRGDAAARDFSAFYFRAGRLIGIDSVNRPQDHLAGRKLLDRGVTISPTQAADPALALSALLS